MSQPEPDLFLLSLCPPYRERDTGDGVGGAFRRRFPLSSSRRIIMGGHPGREGKGEEEVGKERDLEEEGASRSFLLRG